MSVSSDPYSAPTKTQRPRTPSHEVDPRASVGLAGAPTIVAIGPFDDHEDARQLAAAFVTTGQHCAAQLVLLDAGVHCTAVVRRAAGHGRGGSVRVVNDVSDSRWVDVVAAADLVVLSSSSGTAILLDVLAAGRPVVVPACPATVRLVVPAVAGLVYSHGDGSALAVALLRLATAPALCRGMGDRAREVARRQRQESFSRNRSGLGTDRWCPAH